MKTIRHIKETVTLTLGREDVIDALLLKYPHLVGVLDTADFGIDTSVGMQDLRSIQIRYRNERVEGSDK